ncbi:MAG TPA: FtsX-like permease family protein, partial [Rhodothermales bacterium]|nr:FtsX-like permease family protein [Rhodothermales bacterium]
SLHQEIAPVVINIKPWISYVAFRLTPGDATEAVDYLQTQWQRFAPGFPFDYRFLDEDFDRLYRAEQDLGQMFTFFACIAIFVACLGLFGLAAYSAEQRTKEIGVRKVLGASVRSITLLLSKEFTMLVLIAFVLAAPIAFFVMNGWLDDFAYRTSVGVGTFVLAAVLALTIAWLTVSYQAIKAAVADPVKSLRYE